MKYILSAIKFITILGLGVNLLVGCGYGSYEPAARESTKRSNISSDGNYWIDPNSGAATDLRTVEEDSKKQSCWLVAQSLPADDRLKYLRECGALD